MKSDTVLSEIPNDVIINELDIEGKILAIKEKKIIRYPVRTIRASSIGYFVPELKGCRRRGVYTQTNWEDKELHTPKVQCIFDEGHLQEAQVLKDMAEAGITVIDQQNAYEWKRYNISLHIDGKIPYLDYYIPIEIKSMNPNIFQQVKTYEDFDRKPWLKSYKAQINIYMLAHNIDKAVLICKDKSNGLFKIFVVNLDYELSEACLKTAESINRHIKEGTLPPKIEDLEVCKKCPFKLICCPDINFGTELRIEDDPAFEQRLDFWYSKEELAKEVKAEREIINKRILGTALQGLKEEEDKYLRSANMIVGKYRVTGKYDAPGKKKTRAFRTKIELVDYEAYTEQFGME